MVSRFVPDAVALSGAPSVPRVHHLVEVLRERARRPDQATAYTFLDDGEAEGGSLSWAELDAQARAIAVHLAEIARPGDRALLLFPAGLDFIAAFFGCLYAGVVAVPSYPPRPNPGQQRLRAIVRDAAPAVVLTGKALLPRAAALAEDVPELAAARWLATDDLGDLEQAADAWRDPGIRSDDLAFLQYTSGSTSLPKGVMVSHANLVANERMIAAAFRQTEESVVVGWLPLYHDMGLIGNVLQPLWSGGRCVLMSPVAFLQKPLRWLAAISRYGATTSGGPNFAYDLCARKIATPERTGLDLSRWRVAYNGAEPVRRSTLDRFAAAFAECGFNPEAFYPCYGLAEATLFAAGGAPGTGAHATAFAADELGLGRAVPAEPGGSGGRALSELVACGDAWLDQRLVIVDPESRQELPEGKIGEIWIAGPNVGGGYWGRAEASAETFAATTALGAGPYLRTGDLGFRRGADLYIAGRQKDLIILRGRNLYPQDLEATAEAAHPALRPGCGAAFSIAATAADGGSPEGDESERLVLVYEVDRRAGREVHEEIAAAVRAAIAEEHEAQVADLVLVKVGGVPKTSSGKVQRHACRDGYLKGTLAVVARSAAEFAGGDQDSEEGIETELSRDDLAALPGPVRGRALEGMLRAWAARALGISSARIERDRPLSGYGLDSLAALELRSSVEERLGVALPLATLFEGATLGDLATLIAADLEQAAPSVESGLTVFKAADAEMESADFPLSYGQEGLWVVERLAPAAGAYNLAAAFRVEGIRETAEADWPERLRAALLAIVARHPALRLRLIVADGEPRQRLAAPDPEGDLDFAVEDLGGRSAAQVLVDLGAAAYRPFDLARGPLLRVRVIRGASGAEEEPAWLLFAAHHSVVDFTSLGTIARDLASLWAGGVLAAPAPGGDYVSWLHWQRDRLAGPAGERLRAFWRERLGAGVPDLDLPADRPRPPAQSFSGAVASGVLPPGVVARLEALARSAGATLQATLLAGFAAELARTSGQDGFAVGVPTAGRSRSRFAEAVGYFVNPVAVRARTESDPSFRELLERTRDELLGALEQADEPFSRLAGELVPERDAARSPLFQAMLVHHVGRGAADVLGAALAQVALGEAGARLDLGGLALVSLALPERRAQFDLTLRSAGAGVGEALVLALEANADLFDPTTAARLLDRFALLLSAAAETPETALSALPRLATPERHQLLVEWNDGGASGASGCLHELFAAQAVRTPEAEALLSGEERLTYAELRRRVARLAGRLVARGAGPEIRVAVCLNRSVDLVVALLAVLESGAAYVPLDPTYPRERLALMLGDSAAKLLITEQSCLAALPDALPETLRLEFDPMEWPTAESARLGLVAARVEPGNLAYLIYTSGSTGKPKAVAIEHRSVVALARWARKELSDAELSGVAAVTSVCFDLSVFELFVPLCWGGRTILADDALALPAHPARTEISLINTVPSAMAELVRLDVAFPALRAVILAGEPLPGELVERIYRMPDQKRALPELTVRNLYGPSEDTTYSTGAVIPHGEPRPSIGRPIEGSRAYLLDPTGRPAARGVPGELFLGGAGLARGYLDRPETTAGRFVPDPFADANSGGGGRLYRTGDLARYRADGELDFLGRADHQVKIRGFRIELGEIETALLAHPEVRECVVVAAGERLIAYFAPSSDGLAERLPGFLAATLPGYMVPSAFVQLPTLPRSANGKVDRKALPAPRFGTDEPERRPADDVEQLLGGQFAEVLGVERVGLDDDFFSRGGHSLAAMRLLARVGRAFGIELPARTLFEAPTIARLAENVRAAQGDAAVARASDLPIERIAEEERGQPLPTSFAQRRIWFLERLDPGRPTYHLPGRLALSGALDVPALTAALRGVVARHEALRTGFAAHLDGPVQIVAPAVATALPAVDLRALPGAVLRAEADRAAGLAACQPFDLSRPPLLRALLLALGAGHNELILNLHHLVSDGWSLGILAEEIGAGYRGLSLAPLPIQVADAASWERRLLAEGYLEREERYWAGRLAEPPPPLDLPVRPAISSARGTRIDRALGASAATLDAAARRLGATPFMLLAAAWGAVLGRFGDGAELLLGTPVSVRTRPELEPLIGCFVNTVALRVDLHGDPSYAEQVERLRAVCLEAYAHRHLPYDRLVELLRPAGAALAAAPFQAFLVLDEGLPAPRLQGLETRLEPLATETAKFDLTLALERRGLELTAALEYARDRFEADTAERILAGFARLFEAALGEPELRLSELPLLDAQERAQLIAWGAGPKISFDGQSPLLLDDLVARWERETPNGLAVVDPSGGITYAQLGARANRLAWRLRALGVVEDERVAICLDRSVDLIVAELGALRAGGAYAPIDPAYPEERRADMVAVARAQVVITRVDLVGTWCGEERGVSVLTLDALDGEGAAPLAPPPTRRDPERLAYTIFTSGSSGRPKGVAMSHRGAAHIVSWHLSRFGWTPADRGTQVSGPSFDAAVIEIWPALSSGASLHIPPADVRLGAPSLLSWLARERVTIAWAPTAIAEGIAAITAEAAPEGLALRFLQTGGDRLHRGVAPDAEFVLCNQYGPAENAVITTQSEPIGSAEAPSIGRPIDGVRVHVLDRCLDRAPAGTPGELVVSGGGLARGYLDDPAQTAERFVPDPFAAEPGSRMYRTGDRVRFRAGLTDGEIEFLGRLDAQVKIRGQRIELGEIEAALLALPEIRAAAAGVCEGLGGAGDRRLVAYLVLVPGAEAIEDGELIAALKVRLGDAMVPRIFLRLAALPLTANGKVDARALEALALPAIPSGGLPPRTELEARLAAIWAEVLKVDPVGVEDDFFALGGHSLLAGKLAYRLQEELGFEVPVATLFSAPTVAQLAREISALSVTAALAEPIPRVDRTAALPLSVAQERIWFLEELEGPSALHHIAAAFDGSGRLDVAALRAALSGVWSRHEALRARFAVVEGGPVQSFAPPGKLPLSQIDLPALPVAAAAAEADRLSVRAARLPFALGQGPLLRAWLVRLGEERFRLALVVHHLVADGVSLGILEGELAELYAAAVERRPAALADLPCQYADFAAWQRARRAPETAAEIEFWRTELEGLPPLELPVDLAPAGALRHHGRTLVFGGGGGSNLGTALAMLASKTGTTPFVALLAGFSAALARFSGQEEFGLGVPESGRPRREAELLVGLFVNTVVVRVDTGGDPSGNDLAGRLRERLAAALAHARTPFERLVEALAPGRERESTPWFQAMAAARPAAAKRLVLRGAELTPVALDTGTAKFDLALLADATAGADWRGAVEYDAGRFEAVTVERWIGQLERLLADLAERPATRLSELRLLSDGERAQLLAAATGPEERPIGSGKALLLDDLVAHWETATPAALAVVDPNGEATYTELGARANALAWRLRGLGIAEDSVVAVCLDRSIELIAAELGVLRAGAAYAPIDPAYPAERRADMVAVAGASAVVTLSSLVGDWVGGLPVVLLDHPPGGTVARDDAPPPVLRDSERLAYAIFTSGSTGKPKCVGMSHRGALHIVAWHLECFGWTAADRGTQVSGPSFDAAVIEIWPALVAGASLHVPAADVRLSAPDLLAWLARERLTIGWAPTPLVELMVAEGTPQDLALRFLQTGGDRLHRGAPAGSGYLLCNQYGPAENAVITTQGESAATEAAPGPVPTIGRPIAGVRAYLLDGRQQLAPPGTPGELTAAGAGLARGYLNDPRQTAERFVPDPFATAPGARMYRTGDRARLRPDGVLQFLGRIDTQVKIRGQRIELGEIEAALAALPGVREAAVAVREQNIAGSVDRRLVAFVVAAADVVERDLIEPLRARLADAMVPRVFVRLDALPTTANGKVDRRALARLAVAAQSAAGGAAPGSPLERRIAAAWCDRLGLARVAVDDDFFALGGHSLLAAQLIYRLRDELGLELPVGLLFEAPTVAGLAWRIEQLRAAGAGRIGAPIPQMDRTRPVPLSFAQERLWFLEQLAGPSALYHIPAAFSLAGALDVAAFAAALEGVLARHEALRAQFAVIEGRPVQSFAPAGSPLSEADLSALGEDRAAAEAGRLFGAAARRPFDLVRGPLLRTLLVRLAAERSRLALVVHHLVADGVSLAIVERELSELYVAARERRAPRLAELPFRYADFAAWQRDGEAEIPRPIDAEDTEREVEFWRAELQHLPPLLLPWDREPAAEPRRHRGRARTFAPRPGLSEAVAALAARAGTTPFVALLAGFAAALARWSGQTDFGLGVPEAGRRWPEVEGLVGLFVNTLVVRVDAGGNPDGIELATRLAARLKGALAHAATPFARLVEVLAPERDLARGPWFQAMVAARPTVGRGLELPGVALAPLSIETGSAKFELTLLAATAPGLEDDFATIEYDADLFDEATVDRLERWLEAAWPAWSEQPARRLSELPPLARAEGAQVVRRSVGRPAGEPDRGASHTLETEIAAIWADFLDLPRVARDDDFFVLGGHSLLAARLIYRLREALEVELPVAALFEAPTVAGLARRVEEMRRAGSAAPLGAPPIPRADRARPIPLSFAQERLWFIEQLEGPSALYHIPAAFSVTGPLDLAALGQALDGIWSRHEALRARIVDSELGPVQSFAAPGRAPRFEIDLSSLAASQERPAEESARLQSAAGRRPFDLENGPLLRTLVIRHGDRRFDLVLVLHHLVADGVSLRNVERELSAFYTSALGLPASPLVPLALQHADVAVWQRGRATAEWLAPLIAVQVAELAADDGAAIEPLALPTDRPRSGVARHRGASLALAPYLDGADAARALERLTGRFGTTAFQAWFAAFGALLCRLSGREMLAIGLPVAGRTVETEALVGLFADTRVARAGLPGDPSVADLLATSRARLVATEARGEVPFERLVEALAPARERSVAPLFQVALVSRPTTGLGLHLPGLDLRPTALAIDTAKWDLTLYVDPQARAGAAAGIEYDADLFDPATIGRWLGQLGRLLADMGARPAARFSDLHLFSAAERAELLAAAAGPQRRAVPAEATQLDDLVAHWEAATPEALAVADPSGRLTYGELGARANRLAWRLRDLGVAEESRVAVCLDRSADLIVAELAALRAGAAYAPIDPAYPEARRGDMVALSGAAAVVTLSHLAGPWCGEAVVLALDAEPDLAGTLPSTAPPRRKNPEGLAYAIFTSGSMGTPKGVAMSHRGALHIVSWHLERFGWTPVDRGSQVSGPSFDAAVIEIWPALASGASLHVPAAETRLSAPDLLTWFARERLTIAWSPGPLVELFAGEAQPAGLLLRFLQTGGDRLLHGAPAGAPYVLCNQYGPAESAVITTQGESAAQDGEAGAVPSIGRPISGVRAYVLDRWQGLASRGSSGELGVAGEGLARGYLSDPAQTAERFVPDPFSGEPGGRMYRTGDRVRQRPDGALDFRGRIDRQIKIRGQRIELGEIEAALSALPGVREAAVLVQEEMMHEGGAVDRRLVAFLVLEPGAGHADRELIEALRHRLAEAMVPKSFVRLAALPMTANGKVDRRALARLAPGAASPEAAVVGEGPRGEIEGEVAAIWADLLGRRQLGRDDSFFDLGGHSLLATRAAQRLRQSFGIELPLAVLFDEPTLAGLAHWIAEAVDAGAPSATAAFARPIPRANRGRPLPLSFAQERLWLLDRFEPESATYTIPAAIALSGELAVGALREAVARLALRHESLRTTFALAGDAPVQRIAPKGDLALPLVDLGGLAAVPRPVERQRLYERLAALPFDLTRGPLARFLLVAETAPRAISVASTLHRAPSAAASRCGTTEIASLAPVAAEHALLFALHHSIADGWSIGVLVRDLAALYAAAAAGRAPNLPELPIQVADHAAWQRGELAGEGLAHRLAHWRERLGGAPPALELPLDRQRPALRSFSGAAATLVLAPELADGVRRLARSGGATLFMTLLAAWAHHLGRLAGQDDVVIGTPAAERDRPELEPLIGMFLNTLVLRLGAGITTATVAEGAALEAAPSFRELIVAARARVLDAFAHEVPFERLLDEINPVRDLSRTPLFQAFFNMVNLPEVRLAVEGLTIAPLAAPEASAKFDLTVYAAEAEREIRLTFVYNSDLFEPARIAAMLDQYRELLAQAVAEPDRPAAELSLVSRAAAALLPDPRRPLSAAWVGSVPARFAAWAERAPERLAVEDPEESFTYGEMLARVRRLARRLGRDGVRKGDVVAILGHRSARLAWAVLGVLEAGAAFTILDPAHPPARLVDTLRLARPRGFIALEAAGPAAPEIEACLDELDVTGRLLLPAAGSGHEDPAAGEPELPAGVEIGPDDLAYLSFTSGSTGVPKGILGRHGPLSHFVPWQERRFGFGPDDRYTLLSGLAHDPLQRDLFTPLQTGAAVVAPLPADIAVPGRLAAWLRDARITVAHLTPAMGQILCELKAGEPAPLAPDLRWAFFVGDVLTRRDVARLLALAPNVQVVNYYGSTETQRAVGYHLVAEPEQAAGDLGLRIAKQSLPLGRGIEDVQLLVVNGAGALAGVGEVGEILVRSPHLAAGYLGDEAGTAARFTANPLGSSGELETVSFAPQRLAAAEGARRSEEANEIASNSASVDRVYRTGDLGRYLPDGEVEFAGRADVQVKIRGFRIEPGEIEALLGRHPAVRECVVVARERQSLGGASGEKRLIAYVVLETSATTAELRSFLKNRLPEHMVPAVFAILEKLPVNPNGKVDRKALPEPVEEARTGAFAAPQTEIERTLAAILREVLGVEKVGKDDNFFELGGNSLQMVKVHARVQETFGTDLQVVQLFTHPTVAALAAFLSQGEAAPRPAAVVEDRSEKLATGRDRLKRRLVQRKAEEEQG
ncbi:MAG TPA: non-ribosomal peptide synthase/polyketide synthase [Thermoanaerobaculia bacterium]|nr:non-ribosomal peptide synthase/polyketide synthase [Thermoanaerobaculia bacterium]